MVSEDISSGDVHRLSNAPGCLRLIRLLSVRTEREQNTGKKRLSVELGTRVLRCFDHQRETVRSASITRVRIVDDDDLPRLCPRSLMHFGCVEVNNGMYKVDCRTEGGEAIDH